MRSKRRALSPVALAFAGRLDYAPIVLTVSDMKDIREVLALILFAFFVYALCSGMTVGGKHYGVSDCNGDKGIVVDTGEPVDAGAPEAGR